MPISPIVLQRRHSELGRIRLGAKRGGNGAPMKLETFRFTSVSERYIRDLATLYGGEPQQWDNNGIPSWEVYTTATSIPVIAVKGGLSQWMETWSGGGCTHRCDGERGADGDLCNPDDPAHKNAKPTTRLSVMLPELEAIGVWRMESHGWNAAAEIPAVAELAQYVGDLVPAHLHLVERRAVKDGKTSRFVVPVLDLQIGTARLREIVAAKSGSELTTGDAPAALEQGERTAITSGPAPEPSLASRPQVKIPTPEQIASFDLETARKALAYLDRNAPEHPARDAVYDRVADLEPSPDADGAIEGEVVEEQPQLSAGEQDPDALWQHILKLGGELGADLSTVTADFEQHMALAPAEASAGELAAYLQKLQSQGLDEMAVSA